MGSLDATITKSFVSFKDRFAALFTSGLLLYGISYVLGMVFFYGTLAYVFLTNIEAFEDISLLWMVVKANGLILGLGVLIGTVVILLGYSWFMVSAFRITGLKRKPAVLQSIGDVRPQVMPAFGIMLLFSAITTAIYCLLMVPAGMYLYDYWSLFLVGGVDWQQVLTLLVLAVGGSLLYMLVLFFAAPWFIFTLNTLVWEKTGVGGSICRSVEIVRGQYWKVLGYLCIGMLIYLTAVAMVVGVVIIPLSFVMSVLALIPILGLIAQILFSLFNLLITIVAVLWFLAYLQAMYERFNPAKKRL